jgi:hypothetical protein
MLEQNYDLTCWYINIKRLAELFGTQSLPVSNRSKDDFLYKPDLISRLKEMVLARISETPPPTLAELILTGKVEPGAVFTRTGKVFCKDLTKYSMAVEAGKLAAALPSIYVKLNGINNFEKLTFDYHPDYLTSNSAYSHLQGSPALFLFGMIDEIQGKFITAKPFVIGSVMLNIFSKEHPVLWGQRFEVTVDEIDSFSKVRTQKVPQTKDLELLRHIPEDTIKRAFAAIIGEPDVPKDWGGERSDLVSNHVWLDGKRISTAFAFKGPAKFSPMKAVHLGTNGDQITRLFSEHAGLLILQHCYSVTAPVRETMQAFAKNLSNPRRWCVIDGYDTLRILRAYKPEILPAS